MRVSFILVAGLVALAACQHSSTKSGDPGIAESMPAVADRTASTPRPVLLDIDVELVPLERLLLYLEKEAEVTIVAETKRHADPITLKVTREPITNVLAAVAAEIDCIVREESPTRFVLERRP